MSEIKRLLHKYLSEDAIIVLALEEKANDVGYQVKQGFIDPKTGRITKKGKVDVEKHNHLHEKHFKKDAEKTYNQTNLQNEDDESIYSSYDETQDEASTFASFDDIISKNMNDYSSNTSSEEFKSFTPRFTENNYKVFCKHFR